MKKTIKLDVDGVLRDCVTPLLKEYNAMFNKNVKYDDIKRVIIDICDVRSPLKQQVYTRIKEYKRRGCEIEKINMN